MSNKKKRLNYHFPLWGAMTSTLIIFSHSALAQASENIEENTEIVQSEMEHIEIQGRKTVFAELQDSAKAVDLIDTKFAQKLTADMGEVIARVPGVSVRRSGGLGSKMRFSLNGLTGDQVRFFVDGIPLELTGYSSGISNIPVNLVEHIEVYQGVVPLEFGADALGGAVNLVTDKLTDANGAISLQVGDFGTRRSTLSLNHSTENGFFARFNAFSDTTVNDYEIDIEDNGEQYTVKRFHDDYDAKGVFLDVGFVNKSWANLFQVSLFDSEYDQDIQHNVNMTVPYGEVTYGRKSKGVNIHYDYEFSELLAAKIVMGRTEIESHFFDVAPYGYNWFGEQIITGIENPGEINGEVNNLVSSTDHFARINLDLRLSPEQQIKLLLALTWHDRAGKNLLLDEGQFDSDAAERKLFTLVSGLEHSINLMDDRLQNIFFIKHYHQDVQAQTTLTGIDTFYENERTENTYGWGNAIRYNINDWSYIKASFEDATRLPSSDEIFGKEPSQPNIDLLPEESKNYNLSYTIEGIETAIGILRADTNLFIRDIDNLVRFVPAGRGGSYENLSKAKSEGIQGGMGWMSPEGFAEFSFNVTYMDFVNATTDQLGAGSRIPNEPYFYSNLSLHFNWEDVFSEFDQLTLSWHSRFIEKYNLIYDNLTALNAEREAVPSQFSHAVALTYGTDIFELPITLSAEFQNLTDEKLHDFYGVQRPGRAFNAKLVVEF